MCGVMGKGVLCEGKVCGRSNNVRSNVREVRKQC